MASRLVTLAAAAGMLALVGGCGLVSVEMTSTPDTVSKGDPVTFDIKLTNHSQCPTETAAAVLVAFIPANRFFDQFFGEDIPQDIPPEILAFLEEIRAAFEELCAGGTPVFPDPPVIATSCRQGVGEITCDITRPAQAGQANGGSQSFALPGDRLNCRVDAGAVSCQLRIPLSARQGAGGQAAAVGQSLTCVTSIDGVSFGDSDALCFIGTFPNLEGLGPQEMATGQVTLPARGSGLVRNLAVAISTDEDDLGVCKGGADAGKACDQDDFAPCPGSTCGEGICAGGANEDLGCDVASQAVDCPGSMCVLCSEPVPNGSSLTFDCTNTVVGVEPAPVLSSWALAGMAAALLAMGTLWLRRRRGHA